MSEPILEGSGSFRIDREKAIEKLSRYGMEQGELFLLPWLRCAVAAGASELEADDSGGLWVRFDGQPFSAAELEDPYSALLNDEFQPRLWHFALGLLTCWRTGPSEVTVESGDGPARVRLRAWSANRDQVEPAPAAASGTVIGVTWPLLTSKAPAALAAAAERARLVPEGFSIRGRLPRAASGPSGGRLGFDEGPLRGIVELPPSGVPHSLVSLCVYGVEVERVETWVAWAQVRAWVNDDGFKLDASQSRVAEDERRKAALDGVTAACERLLANTVGGLGPPYPGAAAQASVRAWVHDAAGRLLTDPASDEKRPLLKALWDAPLFLDVAGSPLSLRQLADERRRDGVAGYSRVPCRGASPSRRIAWLDGSQPALACLKTRFGADLRDLTGLIESLEKAA